MNVPSLLKKLGLLSPTAVSDLLSDTLGFTVAPEDVDRWLGYAKRIGPFLTLGDKRVDDLLPSDVQDVVYGVFQARVDDEGAASLLDTAKRMVTSPDETVRDLITSGKIARLLSLGPSAQPKATVIYCPECSNPIIL